MNILTGFTGELAPVLAAHEDVDGLDLAGVDESFADDLAAARGRFDQAGVAPLAERSDPALRRLRAFVETSTVWHTIGQ